MHRNLRTSMYVVSGVQTVFAMGFIFQWSPIVDLWPLPYTNATTYLFIGSIVAAAVASTLWCLLQREDGALSGVFLDYAAILVPVGIYTFQISGTNPSLRAFSIFTLVTGVLGVIMLLITLRIPFRDHRPTPPLVRWTFAAFVVVLVVVGGQLVLGMPNVLPWNVNLSGRIIYGWMFLGAAVYFAYGVVRPKWQNAGGQLAGFLAYDLVLIVPFLLLLSDVRPEKLPNLIVYIAVLLVSGALATYYLFLHPATRVRWAAKR
jgi:hypothetical protein